MEVNSLWLSVVEVILFINSARDSFATDFGVGGVCVIEFVRVCLGITTLPKDEHWSVVVFFFFGIGACLGLSLRSVAVFDCAI